MRMSWKHWIRWSKYSSYLFFWKSWTFLESPEMKMLAARVESELTSAYSNILEQQQWRLCFRSRSMKMLLTMIYDAVIWFWLQSSSKNISRKEISTTIARWSLISNSRALNIRLRLQNTNYWFQTLRSRLLNNCIEHELFESQKFSMSTPRSETSILQPGCWAESLIRKLCPNCTIRIFLLCTMKSFSRVSTLASTKQSLWRPRFYIDADSASATKPLSVVPRCAAWTKARQLSSPVRFAATNGSISRSLDNAFIF